MQKRRTFTVTALSLLLMIGSFSFTPLKINAEGEEPTSQSSEFSDSENKMAPRGEFPVDGEFIKTTDNKLPRHALRAPAMSTQSTSGNTGEDKKLTWKFENGTLTISGNGAMSSFNDPDFGSDTYLGFPIDQTRPEWYDLRDQIQNIVINEGVTSIGSNNFYGCAASTVSIPHSVKVINHGAFGNMQNLKSVVIPEGCESFEGSPFNRTPLESLTVPASLKKISYVNFKSFTDGPGLWGRNPDAAPLTMQNIHITGNNPDLSIEDNVLYGNHGKTIWYADPSKTGTYNIKAGVTLLEEGSFYATNLSSVVIPSSVTEIGDAAFRWANNITEFVIPDSVKTVGTQSIEEMDSLQKLTIGSGVRITGWGTFKYNENLTNVVIKNGIEAVTGDMFQGCTSLKEITLPESVTRIGGDTFSDCSSLTNVRFGSKIKEIGDNTFLNTPSLTSITLPEGLTTIGNKAFYGSGLKSVNIPKSVTSIESDSFPSSCTLNFTNAVQQGTVAPSTDVTYDVQYLETDARSMLDQLNAFRNGSEAWYYNYNGNKEYVSDLGNLTIDARLQKTAMQRAAELALYFAHERPDGSEISTAFPPGLSYYGENIACGQRSVNEVMENWKETNENYNGQGHRRNMLSGDFNTVGIGHVRVHNVDYWVQDFGYFNGGYIDTNVPSADNSVHTEKRTISKRLLNSVNMCENPAMIELKKAGDTAAIPSVTTTNLDMEYYGYSTYDKSVPVHPVIASWWTEDPSVAYVQDGKVIGKKNGTTNLVSYAFQQKISVPVRVGPKPKPTPTAKPAVKPTRKPTTKPSKPTQKPTRKPTAKPSSKPARRPTSKSSSIVKTVTMYRAYNPNSGEHFYTSNKKEFNHIVSLGWKNEGIGWIAPQSSNTPVYRLYNANGGEHHYTSNAKEKNALIKAGWKNEGIGWYSDDSKRTPLYRQYNPNAFANNHNYTTSKKENDSLVKLGWRYEGIGWYGVRAK